MPVTRSQLRSAKEGEDGLELLQPPPILPKSKKPTKTRVPKDKEPSSAFEQNDTKNKPHPIPALSKTLQAKVHAHSPGKNHAHAKAASVVMNATASSSTSKGHAPALLMKQAQIHIPKVPTDQKGNISSYTAKSGPPLRAHVTASPLPVKEVPRVFAKPKKKLPISTCTKTKVEEPVASTSCQQTIPHAVLQPINGASTYRPNKQNLAVWKKFVESFGRDSEWYRRSNEIVSEFSMKQKEAKDELDELFQQAMKLNDQFEVDPQKAFRSTPLYKEVCRTFRDAKQGPSYLPPCKRKQVVESDIEPLDVLHTEVPKSFDFMLKPVIKNVKRIKMKEMTPVKQMKVWKDEDSSDEEFWTFQETRKDLESAIKKNIENCEVVQDDEEEHVHNEEGNSDGEPEEEKREELKEEYVIVDDSDEEEEDEVPAVFKIPVLPKPNFKKGSPFNETFVSVSAGKGSPFNETFVSASAGIKSATFVVKNPNPNSTFVVADETVENWAEAEGGEDDEDDVFNTATIFHGNQEHVNYDITLLSEYDEEGLNHRVNKRIPSWTKSEHLIPSLYVYCPALADEEINGMIFPAASTSTEPFPGAVPPNCKKAATPQLPTTLQ